MGLLCGADHTAGERRSAADLQGVEGSLVKYDEGYEPQDEAQRLLGAQWRVDPSLGTLIRRHH